MFATKVNQRPARLVCVQRRTATRRAASGAVVAITIYKATDKLTTETVISPSQSTVYAALGK